MSDGVKPGLNEDDPANDFVEVDVVVQGQFVSQAHVSEECHQVAKNENQADNCVEKYGSSWEINILWSYGIIINHGSNNCFNT